MSMKHVVGYALLAVGVLVIGYALFASYSIFLGSTQPPELFQEPEPASGQPASFDPQNIEASMDALLQEQLAKIIPPNTVTKTLNLFAWSVFAGLLIFGGTQLAGIGIKLLRIQNQSN